MRTHQELDERDLEYHKAAVSKIDADRSLIDSCVARLERWNSISPHHSRHEWRDILSMPWPKAKALILEDSENGRRIRQTSPLVCLLSQTERAAIAKRWLTLDEAIRYDAAISKHGRAA
jgi:hypothetical protein